MSHLCSCCCLRIILIWITSLRVIRIVNGRAPLSGCFLSGPACWAVHSSPGLPRGWGGYMSNPDEQAWKLHWVLSCWLAGYEQLSVGEAFSDIPIHLLEKKYHFIKGRARRNHPEIWFQILKTESNYNLRAFNLLLME